VSKPTGFRGDPPFTGEPPADQGPLSPESYEEDMEILRACL